MKKILSKLIELHSLLTQNGCIKESYQLSKIYDSLDPDHIYSKEYLKTLRTKKDISGNIEDCFREEQMNEQNNDFDEDYGINDYTGGGI